LLRQFKDKMNESNYEDLYCELKYEHYKEHEIIFNHGDTGRKMYFILQGEVGILIPTGQPEE
jgi:CRP-like cAMP-binding protein